MGTSQETEENVEDEEVFVESVDEERGKEVAEETAEPDCEGIKQNKPHVDRRRFFDGLSVGLGIGCMATFVILWVSVFFTPQLASTVTYDKLLSIFVFPLIYLLAVGLIALTAGVVREYYSTHR